MNDRPGPSIDTKARSATAGSVVAGVLGKACCVAPALFAVLGISGTGIASILAPLHYPLTAVSVAMLGAGFYFAYRKQPVCDAGCKTPADGRRNKVMVWIATAVVVLLMSVPYLAGQ